MKFSLSAEYGICNHVGKQAIDILLLYSNYFTPTKMKIVCTKRFIQNHLQQLYNTTCISQGSLEE